MCVCVCVCVCGLLITEATVFLKHVVYLSTAPRTPGVPAVVCAVSATES